MPNRRYQKGYRYELKCKKALELEGWTVLRTAGSHGAADLVAYWEVREGTIAAAMEAREKGGPLFIQAKVSPTKADREKIDKLRRETGLDWRLL